MLARTARSWKHAVLWRSPRPRSYTMALTRELPDSFGDAVAEFASSSKNNNHNNSDDDNNIDKVNLTLARQQHENYLRELGRFVAIHPLPALPDHPDSVFVEDTAVVIHRRAILMHPGHPSRRNEVPTVQAALEDELGVEIVADLRRTPILADGGDFLYTGGGNSQPHLLIGQSRRTDATAVAHLLQPLLDDVRVVAVPPTVAGTAVLHLKSAVTVFCAHDATLVLPAGRLGDRVLASLPADSYGHILRVPDVAACNVVSLTTSTSERQAVLVQATACETSQRVLEAAAAERDMELVYVDTSELAKKDAALTCCSILLDV